MTFKERPVRTPIDAGANLRVPDQYEVSIRIRNVSTSGFMAECAKPILIGSHVSLEVPGVGMIEAQVRWQLGRRMGGRFVDPISLAQCEWTATKVDPEEAEA